MTIAALVAASAALTFDGEALQQGKFASSQAQAVRGRPATPVSYAGAARRTTRRVTAAAVATTTAAVATTTCVKTVDVYGRVITRCY
jgi:uncharacterized radical SAM superfamily Fe-S cluster-containing enzyme